MATERERTQARLLLEYHGKDYSVWRHIRCMWKGYVVSGVSGIIWMIVIWVYGESWALWLALGVIVGYLARDTSWFHACHRKIGFVLHGLLPDTGP